MNPNENNYNWSTAADWAKATADQIEAEIKKEDEAWLARQLEGME